MMGFGGCEAAGEFSLCLSTFHGNYYVKKLKSYWHKEEIILQGLLKNGIKAKFILVQILYLRSLGFSQCTLSMKILKIPFLWKQMLLLTLSPFSEEVSRVALEACFQNGVQAFPAGGTSTATRGAHSGESSVKLCLHVACASFLSFQTGLWVALVISVLTSLNSPFVLVPLHQPSHCQCWPAPPVGTISSIMGIVSWGVSEPRGLWRMF